MLLSRPLSSTVLHISHRLKQQALRSIASYSTRSVPSRALPNLLRSQPALRTSVRMVYTRSMAKPEHTMFTSGETESVWVHKDSYSNRPTFSKLEKDIETDVCVIGAGIAGVSTAYELVKRGVDVVLIEAREAISGETGRTSGHLSSPLIFNYSEVSSKHGEDGAKQMADSHQWALKHVGDVAKELNINCEYRQLPAYLVSKYPKSDSNHEDDVKEMKDEVEGMTQVGLQATFKKELAIKGWTGKIDQTDAAIVENQATFHPTRYVNGVLDYLKKQSNFSCYTRTRAMDVKEKGIQVLGIGSKSAEVNTLDGHKIACQNAVEATTVPLQKLSVVAEMEFMRTYCIAIRVPKGQVEDCLLYDTDEPYIYVRFTECDNKNDYAVVGGCDHKVGQEEESGRFEKLESWFRERFPEASSVDYKWSGQVFNSVDMAGFIGRNQGMNNVYVITGDTGNGLTHGVLAGKLIADQIQGVDNPWSSLYAPNRMASILKVLPSMVAHDAQINTQYKRFLESDITDIEDLAPGTGGVLNPTLSKPLAVYKDEGGTVHKFSALCPHMKGVVCWNSVEKSFDCPVHGSRFSKEGVCVMGPSKAGLPPADESGEALQKEAITA